MCNCAYLLFIFSVLCVQSSLVVDLLKKKLCDAEQGLDMYTNHPEGI